MRTKLTAAALALWLAGALCPAAIASASDAASFPAARAASAEEAPWLPEGADVHPAETRPGEALRRLLIAYYQIPRKRGPLPAMPIPASIWTATAGKRSSRSSAAPAPAAPAAIPRCSSPRKTAGSPSASPSRSSARPFWRRIPCRRVSPPKERRSFSAVPAAVRRRKRFVSLPGRPLSPRVPRCAHSGPPGRAGNGPSRRDRAGIFPLSGGRCHSCGRPVNGFHKRKGKGPPLSFFLCFICYDKKTDSGKKAYP